MKKSTEILLILASLLIFACSKESIKAKYSSQETGIETYLNSQLSARPDARVVRRGGVQRLVLTEGVGDSLRADGNIAFDWAGFVMNGSSFSNSTLFGTSSAEVAASAGWDLSDPSIFRIEMLNLAEADLVPGLKTGLQGVRGGEECIILFSGKYGFGNKDFGTIPANAALAYHIWVESISND